MGEIKGEGGVILLSAGKESSYMRPPSVADLFGDDTIMHLKSDACRIKRFNNEKVDMLIKQIPPFEWDKYDLAPNKAREFRHVTREPDGSYYVGEWIGNLKNGRGI